MRKQKFDLLMISVAAVFIAVLAGVGYQRVYSQKAMQNEESELADMQTAKARQVAETFNENIVKVAPPEVSQEAILTVYGLLTEKAKEEVTKAPNPSFGLAMFSGVQDMPDQGINIDSVSVEGNSAEVSTSWVYSGVITIKTYEMLLEEEEWRIDAVK